MAKHIRVVATKMGFYLGRRCRPGKEFFVPEESLFIHDRQGNRKKDPNTGADIRVSWFEPVKEKVKQYVREVPDDADPETVLEPNPDEEPETGGEKSPSEDDPYDLV